VEHEIDALRRILPVEHYRRVLDVGCGIGRIVGPLSSLGYAVTGVDINVDALRSVFHRASLDPDPLRSRLVGSTNYTCGDESTDSLHLAAGLDNDAVAVGESCDELARQGLFPAPSLLFTPPDGAQVACHHFTHNPYPSVLTERVSAARSRRLHQRLGESLEQAHWAHPGAMRAQMAQHFAEAGDYTQAIHRGAARWNGREIAVRSRLESGCRANARRRRRRIDGRNHRVGRRPHAIRLRPVDPADDSRRIAGFRNFHQKSRR